MNQHVRGTQWILSLLLAVFFVIGLVSVQAADWQWSVTVDSMVSKETKDHPRAFLWIPPNCKQVRAVVVGQHNMEEEGILEHPKFRTAMAELGLAEVWVTPGWDLSFRFDKGAGEHFTAMMEALALESGYSELATVPIAPIGHSAAASYPWNFAAWNPDRTLAAVSVSGQWPYYKDPQSQPDWGARTVDGVPGLVTMGEYEAAENRAGEGLKQLGAHPKMPMSMLAESSAGHFDFSDQKVEFIALYLKKAVQYRLGKDGKVRSIDPTKEGWLTDRMRIKDGPKASAAAVGKYTGDPKEAFWWFDEELAKNAEKIRDYQRGKKVQLLGYIQEDKIVQQNPKAHLQDILKFIPLNDGVSFKLTGTFDDKVQEGRPEGWSGLPKGSSIGHAAQGGPITLSRICGPVVQTAPDTWSIRFYRMGMNNGQRSSEICLLASHPGDSEYKRMIQQSSLRFPLPNKDGADQKITFPEIPNQAVGVTSLKLDAKSDSGMPVYYYVREGAAEVTDNTLKFTAIPPRTKMPMKVTVVAWQYGRTIDPKIKTATPVERTFLVGSPSAKVADDAKAMKAIWDKASTALGQAEQTAVAAQQPTQAQPAGPSTPLSAGNVLSFHFCKELAMRPTDMAGAEARVTSWNNIKQLKAGETIALSKVLDKEGNVSAKMSVNVKGGSSAYGSNSFEISAGGAGDHDAALFNGVFDQDDGNPTEIEVKGVPFASYDVVFYRNDDGAKRAGKFQIGNQTLYVRGGAGNPTADGKGYVRSTSTSDKGVMAGNYVRFEKLSGRSFTATFTAIPAGDECNRSKVVGFQIIERM